MENNQVENLTATETQVSKEKSSLRKRADKIKEFRCKNLIVVLEDPKDPNNVGTVIRNINALGAEKLYLIDIKIYVSKKDSLESGETELISVFNKVFPDEDKVLMDLYSGILIVHLNLEDSYEKREKLLIEFRNGLEQERRIYDNQKFKKFIDDQFELYKTTEEYKETFAELKKLDDKIDNEDKFIESLIRTYTPNFTTEFLD